MQLRSTIVAIIIAAAAGGSAVRAFGSHATGGDERGERSATTLYTTTPAGEATRFPPSRHSLPASANATAVVYVAGAVLRPGVYALSASARANDALRAAGGPAPDADLVAVNLAARIADGDEIAVPVRGATEGLGSDNASHTTAHRSRRAHRGRAVRRHRKPRTREAAVTAGGADGAAAPSDIVDVNSAAEAELETLPGVGPSLAERIVAFRDLNGPFASSDELLDVGGMTAAKVDALSPYIGFR